MLWGEPRALLLLLLIPILALLAVGAAWQRRRRLRAWADTGLWPRLAPARRPGRRGAKIVLFLLALVFAGVAAARPQTGARTVEVERRGIDVLFALDVSLSMEAADVVPSRLERAKQEIREIMDGLRGDRVGILLFSGSAFLYCPLTLDAGAARLFLDAVEADVLPDPGTNLEAALAAARDAFAAAESEGGQAVVLFTDGESHEGRPLEVASELGRTGIPVLCVGVGTPAGEPIPIVDAAGRATAFKKDRSGTVVLSRLDEATLRQVGGASGGDYFPATLAGGEVARIQAFLDRLQRGELGGALRHRADERFQIPAGIATIFLLLALLLPEAARSPGGEAAASFPAATRGRP